MRNIINKISLKFVDKARKSILFTSQTPAKPAAYPKFKKKKAINCPNCSSIYPSKDEKFCRLCGSPRPK